MEKIWISGANGHVGSALVKMLDFEKYKSLFGENFPQKAIDKAKTLEKHNLLKVTDKNIYLTNNGMLLSNGIITEILEALE